MKEKIIRMAHGAGGQMMNDLIRDVFATPLDNPYLRQMADSAVVDSATRNPQFAISTDSFVVIIRRIAVDAFCENPEMSSKIKVRMQSGPHSEQPAVGFFEFFIDGSHVSQSELPSK